MNLTCFVPCTFGRDQHAFNAFTDCVMRAKPGRSACRCRGVHVSEYVCVGEWMGGWAHGWIDGVCVHRSIPPPSPHTNPQTPTPTHHTTQPTTDPGMQLTTNPDPNPPCNTQPTSNDNRPRRPRRGVAPGAGAVPGRDPRCRHGVRPRAVGRSVLWMVLVGIYVYICVCTCIFIGSNAP